MTSTTETTAPISLRLSCQTNTALETLATLKGTSKSELIRDFILRGLERETSDEAITELSEEYERRWRELSADIRSQKTT